MQIALPRPGARDLVRMPDGFGNDCNQRGNHCNERGEGKQVAGDDGGI
jgi:hypothetical protein